MHPNLDSDAINMLRAAEHFAYSLGHLYVGTEHVLYAFLARERGPYRLDSGLTAGKVVDAIIAIDEERIIRDARGSGMSHRLSDIMMPLLGNKRPVSSRLVIDAILAEGNGVACELAEKILYKDAAQLRSQLADLL